MFRPISGKLERRLRVLRKRQASADQIQSFFVSFFRQYYPIEHIQQCLVAYDDTEKTLTIEAGSKAFANELLLRVGTFRQQLQTNTLRVSRIIIR